MSVAVKTKAAGSVRYGLDGHPSGVTIAQFKRLNRHQKREVMETWFRDHFYDPVEDSPYNDAEGGAERGYLYIHGGPCDAREELEQEFEDMAPNDLIEKLANDLSMECEGWVPGHGALDETDFAEEVDVIASFPDDFDFTGSARFSDEHGSRLRQNVLDKLEIALRTCQPEGASLIGHNNPPEPLQAIDSGLAKSLGDIAELVELKREISSKRPSAKKVKRSTRNLERKYADRFLAEAAESGGKAFGQTVGKGLGGALNGVLAAIMAWLSYLLGG